MSIIAPEMRVYNRPFNRCFLYVDEEESTYIGCLLFDDSPFCQRVGKLLQNYRGCSIRSVGDLDLGHTL